MATAFGMQARVRGPLLRCVAIEKQLDAVLLSSVENSVGELGLG